MQTQLVDIDLDGDSVMHSSPELDADDEMFPDEVGGPSTPTNAAAFSLDAASELSPPGSQGPSHLAIGDDSTAALTGTASTLNANGKRVYSPIVPESAPETQQTQQPQQPQQFAVQVDKNTGYTWDKPEDEPGYEWLNKRAQEEAARAYDQILDRNIMIKRTWHEKIPLGNTPRLT